jgi:putative heme transporter
VTRQVVTRVILLLVAAVSLYLLLPKVLDVFSSWPQLRGINLLWLALAIGFEALAFIALWTLQRIAMGTRSWFAVGTSQLAANAAGSIIPGGGAASGAVQYGMLLRAGVRGERVASGLTASAAATTAAVFALPVVATIAGIGGEAAPDGLRKVAYIGGAAFVLLGIAIVSALAWDRPLLAVGRGARAAAGWVGQRHRLEQLPARLLVQRDGVRSAVAAHPFVASLAAIGKWGFDYLALLCVLKGLAIHAEPSLVLLAYAAAALLALIPLTPGGLGFVEAGLTGLLILAGVNAGDAAAATLAYRLVSYWLPLPAGLAGYALGRHRYGATPATATANEVVE